jgi:hypothetical protein
MLVVHLTSVHMFCNLCIYCSCTNCVSYNQMGTKGAAVFLVRHLCFSTTGHRAQCDGISWRGGNAERFEWRRRPIRVEVGASGQGQQTVASHYVSLPLHRVQGRTRLLLASDDLNRSMVFPCPIVGPALVPCSRRRPLGAMRPPWSPGCRRRRSSQSLSVASIVRTAAGGPRHSSSAILRNMLCLLAPTVHWL